jgi:hypothetical protein
MFLLRFLAHHPFILFIGLMGLGSQLFTSADFMTNSILIGFYTITVAIPSILCLRTLVRTQSPIIPVLGNFLIAGIVGAASIVWFTYPVK